MICQGCLLLTLPNPFKRASPAEHCKMNNLKPIRDVAVVMPAYQAGDTIKRALDSIAKQTVAPREVIVIDDGSTDGTLEQAMEMSKQLGDTKLIVRRQENLGPGAARNAAVTNARAQLLAFLDADDEWLPTHLEASLKFFDTTDCTMTCHNEWLVENGIATLNDCLARRRERDSAFVAIYRKGCISTSTVVVRRDHVAACGGFDPDLANGQDVDLWLAVLARDDAKLHAFEDPLSRYFIRPGSIDSHIARRRKFHQRIAYRWAWRVAVEPDGKLRSVWFRITAIEYEAVRAHIAAGAYATALVSLFRYPINLVRTTKAAFRRQSLRGNFLSAGDHGPGDVD